MIVKIKAIWANVVTHKCVLQNRITTLSNGCAKRKHREHIHFLGFLFFLSHYYINPYISIFADFLPLAWQPDLCQIYVRKTQDLCFFNSFIVFLDESFDCLFDKAKLKLAENWIFIFSCVLRTREKSPNTKGCFKLPIQRKKKYFITISIFWKTFFTLRNRTKFNMRDDISQFLEQ